MTSVVYAAKQTVRFQQPPHERTGPDEVLLLRVPPVEEGQPCTWRLPTLGEFEPAGESEPLTDTTNLVRLDTRFEPDGVGSNDYQWCSVDLLIGNSPTKFHLDVPPAVERFSLEQRFDAMLARIDSNFNTTGDSEVSSTIEKLQRELDALKRQMGTAGERAAPRVSYKPGELHAVVTNDASGRPITKYVGHSSACWDQFNPAVRYVRRLNIPGRVA